MRTIGRRWLVATLLAASRAVWAGPPPLIRHEATRMSMAAPYAIVAYGPDAKALAAAAAAGLDEVDRIDRLMSHYKPDSPLSQINGQAGAGPVRVDPELFEFLAECLRYSRESGGAFDVTVGPLMKAWGFFRGEGRLPGAGELDQARSRIGYQHVVLDHAQRTVRFDRPGMELDLGGIAKGYAVDRAVAVLRAHHVPAALVSAGGSTVYGLGAPPGRDAWEVTVQDPVAASRTAFRVRLRDRALSVSGTHEKSFEVGGVTYSHVMDPRTGRPAPDVLGVAVLTDTGTAGDALDNALFVQGVTEARASVARMKDTEAFFFLPARGRHWKVVHVTGRVTGRVAAPAQREVDRSTTP